MDTTWIYLTDPTMKGAAVRRWQEILLALKYDLGTWGADGVFGKDTDTATRKFQTTAGLDVDGVVGANTLAAAQAKMDGGQPVPAADPHLKVIDGVEVWDYRGEIPAPKNGRQMRPWGEINSLVLHRTACVLGEKPERYFPVNCHIGVSLEGRIFLIQPFELMIWHSHGTSPFSIGVEFDGNGAGKEGYWWRPGGGPHPCTDAQAKAADVLLTIFVKAFASHGQTIKCIWAHRQSSKDRECDPGFSVWQRVGIPWMEAAGAIPGPVEGHPVSKGLELPVGYAGDTFGDGLQLPTEWDARSRVPFFRK